MVTLALIQGVLNTFVILLSRLIGGFVDRVVFRNERRGFGIGYFAVVIATQILLGVLASMWCSGSRGGASSAPTAAARGSPAAMG